jgi:hypothetical protein
MIGIDVREDDKEGRGKERKLRRCEREDCEVWREIDVEVELQDRRIVSA